MWRNVDATCARVLVVWYHSLLYMIPRILQDESLGTTFPRILWKQLSRLVCISKRMTCRRQRRTRTIPVLFQQSGAGDSWALGGGWKVLRWSLKITWVSVPDCGGHSVGLAGNFDGNLRTSRAFFLTSQPPVLLASIPNFKALPVWNT